MLLANKENWSYFLENNCFCQAICKYVLAITSREMEALVTYKALPLPISKVNVEILGKFDTLSIAQYQRHYVLLITPVLCICTGMESVKNDQEFQSNDKKDRLELGDIPSQKIPEN